MAQEETNISKKIQIEASKHGFYLMRNNRGMFYPVYVVKKLIDMIVRKDFAVALAYSKNIHPYRAGLEADGSSDLIGMKFITITPEMIGKKLAIFTAIEVKTKTGTVSKEQSDFITMVRENGGISAVCNDEKNFKKDVAFPF